MPDRHKRFVTHRQSRRLAEWDYTYPAAYFVTICTHERGCLFGYISDGIMHINPFGRVATEEWHRSEALRAEVYLDAFVVMPNHVHGIVVIAPPDAEAPTNPRGYDVRVAPAASTAEIDADAVASTGRSTLPKGPAPRSLSAFISGYKSVVTKRINQARGTPGAPIWQRNYQDHIIRTEQAWHRIRRYIETNPARWADDTYYAP